MNLTDYDLIYVLEEMYNQIMNWGSNIEILSLKHDEEDIYKENAVFDYDNKFTTKALVKTNVNPEKLSEIGRQKKANIIFSISKYQLVQLCNFLYPSLDINFILPNEIPIGYTPTMGLHIDNNSILTLDNYIKYNNLTYKIVNIYGVGTMNNNCIYYAIECIHEVI